jgi:hypothetical protein
VDADEQRDLKSLLKQWKKTTAFGSHEPLDSVHLHKIQDINNTLQNQKS